MKTVEFNEETVGEFRERFLKDLSKLGEKYGVTFSLGKTEYNEMRLDTELKVIRNDEDGKALNPYAAEFKEMCQYYGFKELDLGKEFALAGRNYKVWGLKTNFQSDRLLGEDVETGKIYRLPEDKVLKKLHPKAEPPKLNRTPKELIAEEMKEQARKDKEEKKLRRKEQEEKDKKERIKRNQLIHEQKIGTKV